MIVVSKNIYLKSLPTFRGGLWVSSPAIKHWDNRTPLEKNRFQKLIKFETSRNPVIEGGGK